MRKFLTSFLFIAITFASSNILESHPVEGTKSLRGDGVLSLYSPSRNERESFVYLDDEGNYNENELKRLDHFFRCRLTGEVHQIDRALIELLDSIEDHFHAHELKLISEYRSPARNSLMRSRSRGVAKNSLHTVGKAADIEISGVPSSRVRDYAYRLAKGGVGFYGNNSFVHVDTGKVRRW